MDPPVLAHRIASHLRHLVEDIGARPPGTASNRAATDYLQQTLAEAALTPTTQPFRAKYWVGGEGVLRWDGESHPVHPDPFSRSCRITAPVLRLSSIRQLLEGVDADGRIVVLDDELSAERYFPKNFPFVQFPDQLQIIAALEQARPPAVLAVSGSSTGFDPVFEDADLSFPSATVPPSIGSHLEDGTEVELCLEGEVREGDAFNVSTLVDGNGPRTVVCAHVDTKPGTPGAFDNGGSVATLLAMAEAELFTGLAVELVFFNGEDHYAAPGEQAWLAATDLGQIRHVVNLDGTGIRGRRSSASALAFPDDLVAPLDALLATEAGWVAAPPWYESDHAIFAMRGIPSLAITSENVHDLLQGLAHTAADTLDKVDPLVLVNVARFVGAWLTVVEALALSDR